MRLSESHPVALPVPMCASRRIAEPDRAAAPAWADIVGELAAISVAGIPAEPPESSTADTVEEMEMAAVMAWPRTATAA